MEDEARMGGIIEEYFRTIHTTSNPFSFDNLLNGIQPAMTEKAIVLLGRDFHAEEVQIALS